MLIMRFSPKKIIAAILPFCFLWLFAACVLSCADEAAKTHHTYSLSETAGASDSDSCPIVNAPDATMSERGTFDFQVSPVVLPQPFPVEVSSFAAAGISRRDGKPLFREPPLKRLPVLRI